MTAISNSRIRMIRCACHVRGGRYLAVTLAVLCLMLQAPAASAWKPTTHVFAANLALNDAMTDGKVLIPPFGRIAINADAYRALKAYPEAYRSGVVGPDVLPDIFVGQSFAHVDHSKDHNRWISNDWLVLVFSEARKLPPGPERDRALAFAYGYMTHAAGDMFGHTYVNGYAGGVWDWGNMPLVSRHVVLEGYVGLHTPPTNVTVHVPEGFVANVLIKSPQARAHLIDAKHYKLFLERRDWIDRNIDKVWDPVRKKVLDDWRGNIDAGLRELVKANDRLGRAVLEDHLPDGVSAVSGWIDAWVPKMLMPPGAGDVISWILQFDPLAPVKAAVKDEAMAYLKAKFPEAAQAVAYWTSPGNHIDDPQLFPPGTRAKVDQEMHLASNGQLSWQEFEPLYNTVVMSKLILLDGAGLNELARRAGVAEPLYAEGPGVDVMLYVTRMMDGDHQWEGGKFGMTFPNGGNPMAASTTPSRRGAMGAALRGAPAGAGGRAGTATLASVGGRTGTSAGGGPSGFLLYSNPDAQEKIFGHIFRGYGPGPGPVTSNPVVKSGILLRK